MLLLPAVPTRCTARVEARSVMDAILVQDGAQQAQAVILPLLVRAAGVHQVAQVAQVEPQAPGLLAFGFGFGVKEVLEHHSEWKRRKC